MCFVRFVLLTVCLSRHFLHAKITLTQNFYNFGKGRSNSSFSNCHRCVYTMCCELKIIPKTSVILCVYTHKPAHTHTHSLYSEKRSIRHINLVRKELGFLGRRSCHTPPEHHHHISNLTDDEVKPCIQP